VKIAGYFGYAQCVEGVLARCGDPSDAVRRAAVEQLPFFEHAAVVPALLHALEFDTPPVRAAAAAAFGHVGGADALRPLLRALDDADPWVRYFAVRSIGAFRDAAAAPRIRETIERDPAGQVRLAAIDVWGRLGGAGAIELLQPLTAAADMDIATAGIRTLAHLRDERSQALLEQLLRTPEPWRRLEAAVALGTRGGPDTVSTLQWAAAAETERDVAAAAVAALSLLASREDGEAAAAADALVALAAEPARREAVVSALSALPARRIGDIAKGLRSPSVQVRLATIAALSRMKQPEATRWVEGALDDPIAAVRTAAVAELRRLGARSAIKKLLSLARTDPDRDVRQAAVVAVTQGGAPAASDELESR
jgi:HEAT repeat protein